MSFSYARKLSILVIVMLVVSNCFSITFNITSVRGDDSVRIMPLGNSITVGMPLAETMVGYRQKLYLDLIGSGFNVDFVGSQSNGTLAVPEFDTDYEAYGGWSIEQIRDNVYSFLVANPADIILLHIGTNDLYSRTPEASEVAGILDNIDQYETDYTVNVIVVLARIILRNDDNETLRDLKNLNTTAYNDAVETMAQTRIDGGDDIILVDMENALDYPGDMVDQYHPNTVGYAKMANVWYDALDDILTTIPGHPVGMISYWKLDETSGTIFDDFIGHNDGSSSDTHIPTAASGIVNGGQDFDGIDDYINVADDPSLDWESTSSFSIELWASFTNVTDRNRVMVGRDQEGGVHWWLGANVNTGYANLNLKDTSGNGVAVNGITAINDGEWHHIVAVRDESTNTNMIYVDGVEENSTEYDYGAGFDATTTLGIGYMAYHETPDYYYDGLLDEIAIYNRTLTETEILQHYNNGLDGHGYLYPVAAFSGSPLSGSEPLNVTFSDLSTSYDGIDSWLWDFGDGDTSTEQNPIHVYDEGVHNVTLTVWESDGDTDTQTKTDYINVTGTNFPPTIDVFSPTETTLEINEGESIDFTHNSSDPDNDTLTYSWLLDTVEKATTQNWTYSTTAADIGTHNVTLVVSDGELADTQEWNVTVNDLVLTVEGVKSWRWNDVSNINSVVEADVDGDGAVEIVTAGYYNDGERDVAQLVVWNGTTFEVENIKVWYWTGDTRINSVTVADVDDEAGLEIVTGGYFNDDIHDWAQLVVWNGTTLDVENIRTWYWTGDTRINSVAVANVDDDTDVEIVTGGYFNDDVRDWAQLVVWNGTTLEVENLKVWYWTGDTRINSVAVANVDDDTDVEIVTGGYFNDNIRDWAQLVTWDGATLEVEPLTVWYWTGETRINSVAVGDVDGDGAEEIVTGGYYTDGVKMAQLVVWNGTSMAVENVAAGDWTSEAMINAIAIGNVDLDAGVDIVTGGYYFDGERDEAQLVTWDGATLALESLKVWYWTSDTRINSVAIGNVDTDGFEEILTGGYYNDGANINAELVVWTIAPD